LDLEDFSLGDMNLEEKLVFGLSRFQSWRYELRRRN